MKPKFADLYSLSEDDRITVIGKSAEGGKVVGFFVDDAPKAERYAQKLRDRFKVNILDQTAGPAGTVLVRVGPSVVN